MKTNLANLIEEITPSLIAFAQELVRTKSLTCEERNVALIIEQRMRLLSYDEVIINDMGNVLGRIGSGSKSILFDSHMDTVGVIDAAEWSHDPYSGDIEGGYLFGRGAADMKCGLAASVYAGYVASRVGLPEDISIYVSCSTMEEDYDGEAVRQMLADGYVKPDSVVICEPTELKIASGHRGRALIEVNMPGIPCHGSMPSEGENPVYLMQEIINRIEKLADNLENRDGEHGSVALTNTYCNTASNNSVPADSTIILDRRLAIGETEDIIHEEMDQLVKNTKAIWRYCDIPGKSWTEKEFLFHSFLPACDIDPNHPLIHLAQNAFRETMDSEPVVYRMMVSTNAVATSGIYGIPTIILGPGETAQCHVRDEHCSIQEMINACSIYAAMCLGL
ncbi:MAG: YgeY family selenium metabolism-linked hydrolase [Lachnospiraceae bacterium]|nr:YgeY family selenium metabolism-linked hydrolase [Candidatus Equihabitans merdae]